MTTFEWNRPEKVVKKSRQKMIFVTSGNGKIRYFVHKKKNKEA